MTKKKNCLTSYAKISKNILIKVNNMFVEESIVYLVLKIIIQIKL